VVHEADVISHEMVHHEAMSTSTSAKGSTITKEALSKRWFIGLESAARTLQATTQLGMRYVEGPLEHHLRTSQAHMHFLSLNIVAYTDTMFSNLKSVRGYYQRATEAKSPWQNPVEAEVRELKRIVRRVLK